MIAADSERIVQLGRIDPPSAVLRFSFQSKGNRPSDLGRDSCLRLARARLTVFTMKMRSPPCEQSHSTLCTYEICVTSSDDSTVGARPVGLRDEALGLPR